MNSRELILKAAPTLRQIKYKLIGIKGRLTIFARKFQPSSKKGVMVLLSLGGGKGSPYVARAVVDEGFDLVVVSATFPRLESPFTKNWIQCDPFGDYDLLSSKVKATNAIAVLVEQRNILLPIKARLNTDLALVDYGQKSHKTSNSKIALREAVDAADALNVPWCMLDDYQADKFPFPFVVKPETGTGSRGITIVENQNHFDLAMQKLDGLEEDETVGGRVFIEAMITGRQFDVEGVYLDGKYHPLSVTEEQYDAIENSLPSAWYLFSPPIGEQLRHQLIDAAETYTRALGVKNGAFHCEMRVSESGEIVVIDYSNRMGYPLLVSACCGYSFPRTYVRVMAGEDPQLVNIQQNCIFQRFVRSKTELASFQQLMRDNPECVVQKNMLGSYVGGIKTYARIALRAESFDEMVGLLQRYSLIPEQWHSYYNVPSE